MLGLPQVFRGPVVASIESIQLSDISPILVERLGRIMREKLTTGDVPFRKAYLGSIVVRVEVDDREIRIIGRKDVLEQAALTNGCPVPGTRSFVRK